MKTVYVAIIGYNGIVPEATTNFMSAFYNLGKKQSDKYKFYLECKIKKEQFRARNQVVSQALAYNADYIWMIDDDMTPKDDTFDVLMAQMDSAEDVGVAGCLYTQKGGNYNPVVMWGKKHFDGRWACDFYKKAQLTGGVMDVAVTGGGCMMLRAEAFKKMLQPYFWLEDDLGTDLQICLRMKDEGWRVLCDTGHEIGHVFGPEIYLPSTIVQHVADAHAEISSVHRDLLAWVGISEDQYMDKVYNSYGYFEHKWAEANPETPKEMVDQYENADPFIMAVRNVHFNSKIVSTWAELTKHMGQHYSGLRALEYGCGIGMASRIMAKNGMEVYAADLNIGALEFLEFSKNKDNLTNLNIVGIDGINSPFGKQLPEDGFVKKSLPCLRVNS